MKMHLLAISAALLAACGPLDAVTGHLLWRTTGLGGPINSSAAFDAGRVFFAVTRAGSPFLAAFNARPR